MSADQAEQPIARVVRMHDRVRGTTPDGQPYHANDTRLLDWVQATASFGFCEAYHHYARPLSPAEKSQVFAEGQRPARLYGATGAPSNWARWEQLLAQTAPGLEDSSILGEFLRIMENAPIVPRALRPVQRMLVRAAVDMTPEPVRSFASLRGHGLGPGQRALVGGLGRAARLMPWPGLPPAQARARMRPAPPG